MEQTSLREAKNVVNIMGVLKEKTLEVKTGDKGRYISGYIVVQTDENSAHRINLFANEKTNDGKDSGIFKSFLTVKDDYISLADCTQNGTDPSHATKVSTNAGRLGLNEYYGEDGLHSGWSVSTSFVNRVRDESMYEPKANFEVEGYVTAIREKDDGVFVDLAVPLFGGRIAPLVFSTTAEAGSYMANTFNRGDSINVRGQLVNLAERKVEHKQGFGASRDEVTIKYVRSLVIDGGSENAYDPDDGKKSWSAKDIKAAFEARETYLEELKAKSAKKGTSTSTKTTTTTKSGAKTQDFDF